MVEHETGASAANSGVQFSVAGDDRGIFGPDELAAAIKPRGHQIYPPRRVRAVTHLDVDVDVDVDEDGCRAAAAVMTEVAGAAPLRG